MKEKEISPMINAAIAMIGKVAGVESVEVVSTEMYRTTDERIFGALGVDIIIHDELSGAFKTFLAHEMCEDMIAYPNGMFVTQEFVDAIIHPRDTSKFIAEPDYEFDILKNIDEDGNMSLPQHTGNTETRIDTLPGFDDIKDD